MKLFEKIIFSNFNYTKNKKKELKMRKKIKERKKLKISIESKIEIGDVEKHVKEGKNPRYSYIYPIIENNMVKGIIVSKFSLDKEFHSIEHAQRALVKYILISMFLFFPVFLFLLSLFIIKPIKNLVKVSEKLSNGNFNIEIKSIRNDEIGIFAKTFVKMANNLKAGYERYLSPQVVNLLGEKKGILENISIKKEATIMFCDLDNFTNFSQEAKPEVLTKFLNFYLENMTEILFKHKGTLDKFIGDGIMAVFGVPLDLSDFKKEAVQAAIKMQKFFSKNYKEWIEKSGFEKKFSTGLRIGIATGEVFWGNIGYEKRMEFTSIGKYVNLAARLEKANKIMETNILIDSRTFNHIGELKSFFNKKSSISLKGFDNSIDVYGTIIK